MNHEFNLVNKIIRDFFGKNLISLVVFGSLCREKKFKITSDVDYIILLKNLRTPQDKISRSLKNKLRNVFPLLAFNIYSKNEFLNIIKHNSWMTLTIKLGYEVYFDKNNFFERTIENNFKRLRHQKIGQLAWFVEDQNFHKSFLDHYTNLSSQYLKAARLLYKNQLTNVALELLRDSIHCFMIRNLLVKKVFITTGEITQLFFNVYSSRNIFKFREPFLELEQKSGQKHSFDFDKRGNMFFLPKELLGIRSIFERALMNFEKLQIYFRENIDESKTHTI